MPSRDKEIEPDNHTGPSIFYGIDERRKSLFKNTTFVCWSNDQVSKSEHSTLRRFFEYIPITILSLAKKKENP